MHSLQIFRHSHVWKCRSVTLCTLLLPLLSSSSSSWWWQFQQDPLKTIEWALLKSHCLCTVCTCRTSSFCPKLHCCPLCQFSHICPKSKGENSFLPPCKPAPFANSAQRQRDKNSFLPPCKNTWILNAHFLSSSTVVNLSKAFLLPPQVKNDFLSSLRGKIEREREDKKGLLKVEEKIFKCKSKDR